MFIYYSLQPYFQVTTTTIDILDTEIRISRKHELIHYSVDRDTTPTYDYYRTTEEELIDMYILILIIDHGCQGII